MGWRSRKGHSLHCGQNVSRSFPSPGSCTSPSHMLTHATLQVSDLTNGTTLQEGGDKERDFVLEDQLPDRGDFGGGDFLEDGFGFGDGGMGEFGGVPNVSDIALEEPSKPQEGEGGVY